MISSVNGLVFQKQGRGERVKGGNLGGLSKGSRRKRADVVERPSSPHMTSFCRHIRQYLRYN